MSSLDKARETQLRNIEAKTGKSLAQLRELITKSGLEKHGQIRDMLKEKLGLGHGDANTLVHLALQSDGQSAAEAQGLSTDQVLDGIYTGKKAALRPIHDRLMEQIRNFGPFEEAPKKTYISLRRKKQFAMIGPATNDRIEVGLNMKQVNAGGRLEQLPPGGMCPYKVRVTSPDEVDRELLGWIRQAYDASA